MPYRTRHQLCALVIWLCIFACLASTPAQADQSESYHFRYIVMRHDGQGRVVTVDPTHRTYTVKPMKFFPLGISAQTELTDVSPDKKWVSLIVSPNEALNYLVLVNLDTGEKREIDQQVVAIAWSPDSRYIAFAVSAWAESGNGYLYDISQNMLTILKLTLPEPVGFVWSPDSLQLAVWDSTSTQIAIDLLSLPTLKSVKSLDISTLGYYGSLSVCNFNSSPDMHFVTFDADCIVGQSGISGAKEVYIWDSRMNKVIQVTHLADFLSQICSSTGCGSLVFLSDLYSPYWLSNKQLLIGIDVSRTDFSQCSTKDAGCTVQANLFQTLVFDISDTGISHLSFLSKGITDDISANPITSELAMSTITDTEIDGSFAVPQIKIALLSAQTIVASSNLPQADRNCNRCEHKPTFFWSPDGKTLAYQKANENTVVFVDDAKPDAVSYIFNDALIAPDERQSFGYVNKWYEFSYLFSVGWITD